MPRPASYDRDRALEAAMTLFWAQGYHATSLKDLEQALAMKPGSIYAAFHSKEALFRATLDRYARQMDADLTRLLADAPSPLAGLRAHLVAMASLTPCNTRPSTACMLVKTLLEVADNDQLRALVTRHLDAMQGRLADTLARARAAGELPADADPQRIARRLQTYIFGLKVQAQRETDPARMAQLCQDLADELSHAGTGTREPPGRAS